MFGKHSNKESLAGHALSTAVILNKAGVCRASVERVERQRSLGFFMTLLAA